jgi:hypothetical protein
LSTKSRSSSSNAYLFLQPLGASQLRPESGPCRRHQLGQGGKDQPKHFRFLIGAYSSNKIGAEAGVGMGDAASFRQPVFGLLL